MHNHLKGYLGERLALMYLCLHGLKLVTRNYRCKYGEIDLIMQDGNISVFIEVKSRLKHAFRHERLHVDYRKQQRIILTSQFFLWHHAQCLDSEIRYDIVIIQLSNLDFAWYQDAFSP